MAPAATLLALGVASCVNALAFPSPTSPNEAIGNLWQGWTPKPTQGPYNKRFGAIFDRELFARQDDNGHTCAWIDKNPKWPLTCNAGYACAFNSEVSPHWWSCCSTGADQSLIDSLCTPKVTCSNNAENSNTGSDSIIDGSIILCGTAAPACVTIADQNSDGLEYYFLGCGTTATYASAYAYTLASASFAASSSSTTSVVPAVQSSSGPTRPPPSSTSPSSTSAPLSSTSSKSSTSTTYAESSTTSDPGKTSAPSSGESATSRPTSNPSHHTSTGAIAGGVVGGVAALALIGGIGYLIWRKQSTRVDPLPEISRVGAESGHGHR